MANFIKKIVDRARSRSKSPVKYQKNDHDQWNYPQNSQQSSPYGSPPMGTYNYFMHPMHDPHLQRFHEDCYSNLSDFRSCNEFTNPTDIPSSYTSTTAHFSSLKPLASVESSCEEEHQWNGYSLQVSPHSISPRHFSMVHSRREITIPVRSSPHIEMTEKQDETIEKLSSKATYSEHHSNTSTANIKQNDFNFKKKHVSRPRSISPQKTSRISIEEASKKSRSKSPAKRSLQISETLDYLSPQCQLGGCSATLLVQDTKFLVCKHQLSYVSDYFRSLFLANKSAPTLGAYQNSYKEFAIVVSSFTHPPPAIQFKWFLENAIQTPTPTDITDDTLETCMRLSKRFRAKYLEMKCARYIQDNVTKRTPMIALCWLNWVLKHKFDRTTHDACLPCVAAASVQCLEEHRNLISERLLADLLAAKLRTLYDQVVTVFQTIHRLDHFYMDVVKCPNCGRQQELGKIRIQASPCRKLVGCDRCLKDYNCNLIGKNHNDLQACYQCEHGLVALNDYTSDCQCQIPLLASHLKGLQSHLPSHH